MEQSPSLGQRPRLLLPGRAAGLRLTPFEGVTLLAMLAAALFGGYSVYARAFDLNAVPPPAPTYLPAFRTTLVSSVSATGTVQSSQQVTLSFGGTGTQSQALSGKIKEFVVKLGDEVRAGQPLARLDDTQLQQSLRSAESALASAQARLDAAREPPTTAEIAAGQQSLSSARSAVATAEKNLSELLAKPTTAELAAAQQAVLTAQNQLQTALDNKTKAQAELSEAQSELTAAQANLSTAFKTLQSAHSQLTSAVITCGGVGVNVPPLPPSGSAARSLLPPPSGFSCPLDPTKVAAVSSQITSYNSSVTTYNNAATALGTKQTALTNATNALGSGTLERSIQNAQIGLESARQKQLDTQAGPKAPEIEAARRAGESAHASLTTAQAKLDELFQPAKPDVVLPLQASVDQARANVEDARSAVAAATIIAPFDGRISQVNGEVGSQVTSNTAVFILLNPNLLRIDANVDQADIGNLRPGQTAAVTFDALAGRSYTATITAIGLTPTIQQGVVTYVTTLAVDTSRLPEGTPVPAPGMTASLSVTTSRAENVLAVPQRAIRRVGRNQTVTLKTPAGDEQRTITTGATNGTLTQVVSGLQDGDEVLVSAPRAQTTTAPATGGFQQFGAPAGGGTQIR